VIVDTLSAGQDFGTAKHEIIGATLAWG